MQEVAKGELFTTAWVSDGGGARRPCFQGQVTGSLYFGVALSEGMAMALSPAPVGLEFSNLHLLYSTSAIHPPVAAAQDSF